LKWSILARFCEDIFMTTVCVSSIDDELQHQYVRQAFLKVYGSGQPVGKFKLFTNTDEPFSSLVERVHKVACLLVIGQDP